VEVQVDVLRADRGLAVEGVEVNGVVGDDGQPGAVSLDPRLRHPGRAGRQLQEAHVILVHVQQRIGGLPGRDHVAERPGPSGAVVAHGNVGHLLGQLAPDRLHQGGEGRVAALQPRGQQPGPEAVRRLVHLPEPLVRPVPRESDPVREALSRHPGEESRLDLHPHRAPQHQ
jgi:hypothetical protein